MMDFRFLPSLEHMSLSLIGAALWNQEHIKYSVESLLFNERARGHGLRILYWKKLEAEVDNNAQKLPIPAALKDKLLRFIGGMGKEMLLWFKYHECNYTYETKLPDWFYWTPQGTIDYKKTAYFLVHDSGLHIAKRYRLACIYCMVSYIPVLGSKMHSANIPIDEKTFLWDMPELVSLWRDSRQLRCSGKYDNPVPKNYGTSGNVYAFQISACYGNVAATQHFLSKLSDSEKQKWLVVTAKYMLKGDQGQAVNFPRERHVDVLCFLLSHMNEEQQMEVFKHSPFHVCSLLLSWPWQEHFLKTFPLLVKLFSDQDCFQLLELLVQKLVYAHKDFDYRYLFKVCWKNIPASQKMYVINTGLDKYMLFNLFEMRDQELIDLILKDASLVQKENIISNARAITLIAALINRGKWNFLRSFLTECLKDSERKDHIRVLRNRLLEYYLTYKSVELETRSLIWDGLFQLLDAFINQENKSGLEEKDGETNGLVLSDIEEITSCMDNLLDRVYYIPS